jgi:YYY domain-containing protein
LVVEHWDDLLPVSIDGMNAFGSYYAAVTNDQVPVTHPDSPTKRQQVIEWLDQADYVVLSSQRAVWHLPRLPLSYPIMLRYYEGLFSGELGFDLVAQFHAGFSVGPLHFSDTAGRFKWGERPEVGWPPPGALAAEEAFSVYDHPPVWIFGKGDAFEREGLVKAFGEVDLTQVVPMTPGEATSAPNGLLLAPSDQAEHRANGTFSRIFDVDGAISQNGTLAAIVWWLAVILLGWIAFPIAFYVMPGLPDRGYTSARILSLLLMSYIPWLAASLKWLPNNRETLFLAILSVALASLMILRRNGRAAATFIRQNSRYILLVEALGVALYLLLILVRLGNPDVWDVIWGGEKPMDLSYFTAVLKSTTFPPYDPWFAGGYINYYYYGFVYAGFLSKLLGVVPALAYNLVLPMLFSFAGLGVFGIAYNLVVRSEAGRQDGAGELPASGKSAVVSTESVAAASLNRKGVIAGLIAASMAMLLGNLAEVGVLLDAWHKAGHEVIATGLGALDMVARTVDGAIRVMSGTPAPVGTGDWFWNASRAINYLPGEVAPITEFPFFTFLYGDLHAHMVSMPLMILALGWAIGLGMQSTGGAGSSVWGIGLQWIVGGLAIGVLRATNTWDWPTYLVIGGLAVVLYVHRRSGRTDLPTLGKAGVGTAALIALSIATFWPYAQNYGVGYTAFKAWPGSYTQLTNYLVVYGLFLFFVISYLAVEFRAWTSSWTRSKMARFEPYAGPLIVATVLYVGLLIMFVFRGYWILPAVLTLVLISGLLSLRRSLAAPRRIVLALTSAALALTMFVELFVLDGDIGRMNTVFKFYLQVWLILSVVSGAAAVWSWPSIRRRGRSRQLWQGGLVILVSMAALYPILATKAKWDIRMSQEAPNTLDGMAFMPFVDYGDSGQSVSLKSDYEAIQWMHRNIDGSPVIAEAHSSNPYRSIGNRIAMYTGLPAIVGWDWHQRQQRAVLPGQLVSARIQDVRRLYETTVVPEAVSLLQKYGVEYVYSGELERVYYGDEGLRKFDQMVEAGLLDEVYANGATSIYRVLN